MWGYNMLWRCVVVDSGVPLFFLVFAWDMTLFYHLPHGFVYMLLLMVRGSKFVYVFNFLVWNIILCFFVSIIYERDFKMLVMYCFWK